MACIGRRGSTVDQAINRDTVEQKILELQKKKRDLADAILNENRNVIGTLTKDDLEFLLP
jgi:SNF2 family DNA or RNA helicase